MSTDITLLKGVTVIELRRVLVEPFCTIMLSDLRADIIKIEAPGRGSDTRARGALFTNSGESAYYLSANRSRRSLTLNLKTPDGPIPKVGSPLRVLTAPPSKQRPPPTLGQHTDEILREALGYSDEEIEALRKDDVI